MSAVPDTALIQRLRTTRRLSASYATLGGMAHDPLCDWLQTICTAETCSGARLGDPCEHQWCQCELIAKVRADEKAKWTHVCPDNNCCHQSGD